MNIFQEGYIQKVIEALLFVSDKPVMLEQFKDVFDSLGPGEIRSAIQELKNEYENQKRGMVIVEIAGGYQMLSSSEYVSYIRKFFKTRVKEKLSLPALETLAIVAYKQPVSRAEIEIIRGVNSDGVMTHLADKGLVKIVGRKDAPGRPFIYGTSKLFLEYFGLKSLSDLPKLENISSFALPQPAPEAPVAASGETLAQEQPSESQAELEGNGSAYSQGGENPQELKHAMENIQKDKGRESHEQPQIAVQDPEKD